MISQDEININLSHRNIEHYINCGYDTNNKSTITIKTIDLPKNSRKRINVICDVCGCEKETNNQSYVKSIENSGYYSCSQKCSRAKSSKTKYIKYGIGYLFDEFKTNWKVYLMEH